MWPIILFPFSRKSSPSSCLSVQSNCDDTVPAIVERGQAEGASGEHVEDKL